MFDEATRQAFNTLYTGDLYYSMSSLHPLFAYLPKELEEPLRQAEYLANNRGPLLMGISLLDHFHLFLQDMDRYSYSTIFITKENRQKAILKKMRIKFPPFKEEEKLLRRKGCTLGEMILFVKRNYYNKGQKHGKRT